MEKMESETESSHSKTDPEREEEEEEFEVEEILDHKTKNGKTYFFLKWKGFPSSANTWEIEDNLSCQDVLDRYWSQNSKKKKKKKSKNEIDDENAQKQDNFRLSRRKSSHTIKILGMRKDENNKIFFLVENEKHSKYKLPLNKMKVYYLETLFEYFENALVFSKSFGKLTTQS